MTEWGRNDDRRERAKPRYTRDSDADLPDPKKKQRRIIALVLLVVFVAGMVALQLRSCMRADEPNGPVAQSAAKRSVASTSASMMPASLDA